MLDVRKLRLLREVIAHGSFSSAAFELSYTPSAVSQQMAALEREAGVTLLVRCSRGVHLTDAGRLLLAHAEEILPRIELAERELAAFCGEQRGVVRVATFPSAATVLLPSAVARMRKLHPGVEVRQVLTHPLDAVERLQALEVDLALVFEYDVLSIFSAGDFESVELMNESMLLALPDGHAASRRAAVDVRALESEAWVQAATPSCAGLLEWLAQQHRMQLRVAYRTDDYASALQLVSEGVGVTLIPELAGIWSPPGVKLRQLAGPVPRRRVSALLPPPGARGPAVVALLEALREGAAAPGRDRLLQAV